MRESPTMTPSSPSQLERDKTIAAICVCVSEDVSVLYTHVHTPTEHPFSLLLLACP